MYSEWFLGWPLTIMAPSLGMSTPTDSMFVHSRTSTAPCDPEPPAPCDPEPPTGTSRSRSMSGMSLESMRLVSSFFSSRASL